MMLSTKNNLLFSENETNSYTSILDSIGETPLISLKRLNTSTGLKIYGKMENFNPGGSIKDRTSKEILLKALELGTVSKGDTIIESSSGNMAIGLAQACLFYGLQLIVVVDPKANQHTLKIIKAYGAKISTVDKPLESGGYLAARLKRVQELLSDTPDSFWTNQYGNVENPLTHLTTMREIKESLKRDPDYIFVATSTCGTLMGCAEYIHLNNLSTKVIAVDAKGSVIFGQQSKPRLIPGHGAGLASQFLDTSKISKAVLVSDLECVQGCHHLLKNEAILAGGSSGGVISALYKSLNYIPKGSVCVIMICDRGERYLDTIYNATWVHKHFPMATKV